jgi:hypothetical protein
MSQAWLYSLDMISLLQMPISGASLKFGLAMSCDICNVLQMARGPSGRIVIEIEPELKETLYEALEEDHATLKDWFTHRVNRYLADRIQPSLPGILDDTSPKHNMPQGVKS